MSHDLSFVVAFIQPFQLEPVLDTALRIRTGEEGDDAIHGGGPA